MTVLDLHAGHQHEEAEPDWRAVGDRIETLIDASSSGGAVARERAEELVRLVADLYGGGLRRVLEILYDRGHLDDPTLDALAGDQLVSSLLLVHGLHPYGVEQRIEKALADVRPYLGSHGGDVELLEVTDQDVVRLRLLGSCDGCPSSSITLKLAVEGAIEEAAPEISAIEVESAPASKGQAVIPVDSLFSRMSRGAHDGLTTDVMGDTTDLVWDGGSTWESVVELVGLEAGSVVHVQVGGMAVLACRVGADLFAFRDRCARCDTALTGAAIARRLGGGLDDAVLTCPSCRAHYDVRRAGAGLDDATLHLDPLPLLVNHGVASVAVRTSVAA